MIVAAVICTLLGGVLGAHLKPVSLAISIPIAIMGGFILRIANVPDGPRH